MNIHIVSSLRKFDEDLVVMRGIVDVLSERDDTIALNWLDSVSDRKARGATKEESLDWAVIVEANFDAIKRCDAVVVEGSRFNFSQGYQTALALQYEKPVLNLYRNDTQEYQEWPDKFYVSGIYNPLFTSKPYETVEEVRELVSQFLEDNKKRVHELDVKLALEEEIYKKVEQMSHHQSRSKTGIIKDIITRELADK